jgi:phosphomevalonate kinase
LVLSGAYAVLSGAPALVAAVDRYVLADSARPASFDAPEVRAAIGTGAAPWFDASELREGGKKLGLGSSAAIVVASLAALELDREPGLTDEALAARVYDRALAAHRAAQGGGSGVDVAASAHGGVLAARRRRAEGPLELTPVRLPEALQVEVWACSAAAATAQFLAKIREFAARDPSGHRARIGAQAAESEAALDAALRNDAPALIGSIQRQARALTALGEAAGAAIVTPEHGELARLAALHGAAFLPAGAGGGDVAYYLGLSAAPAEFGARARALGLTALDLRLGARGVHRL